jgi:hypothetical protein
VERLQIGTVKSLLTAQFASFAGIGLGLIAAGTVRFGQHRRPEVDQAIAFTIGGLLILVGVVGAFRSYRCHLRISRDHLKVVGITRSWRIAMSDVVSLGFSRSSFGKVLNIITAEGRALMVWGVTAPRADSPSAAAALESVRSAVEAVHPLPAHDPAPELGEVRLDGSPSPPQGSHVILPPVRRVYALTLPGQLLGLLVVLAPVTIGVQLDLPWTFPWVVLALGLLFVLGLLVPTLLVLPRLRRIGRSGMLAVGDGWLSKRAGVQWFSIRLSDLVAIGAYRVAAAVGTFGLVRSWVVIRLVDRAGHRLEIEELLLNHEVAEVLRQAAQDVPTTSLAQRVLTPV